MAFNFPGGAVVGQEYVTGAGVTYVWNGYGWNVKAQIQEAPSDGKIYGRKDAAWAEVISDVTKAYVDAEVAKQVAATGDTMTGHLALPTGPSAQHAVRKDYVDAADALKVAKAGDMMTGALAISHGGGVYFRERTPTHSVFHYTDASLHYFLLTNSGDPDGGWNSLRPFQFNVNNGNVEMAHAVTIGGALSAQAITSTYQQINGTGATSDPMRITTPASAHARYWSTVAGVRSWSFGTVNWGTFYVADESAGAERFTINTSGHVNINVSLNVAGALSSGSLSTGRIDSSIVYFGSGIYWNHEGGNNRLVSNQNVYSYGYVNAAGGMRCESTFVTAANAWVYGGVLYMSSGGHYIQWDGGNYIAPHGNFLVGGYWVAREGLNATHSELYTSSNVHTRGGHVFWNDDGIWMRWRGDLARWDFSHGLQTGYIEGSHTYMHAWLNVDSFTMRSNSISLGDTCTFGDSSLGAFHHPRIHQTTNGVNGSWTNSYHVQSMSSRRYKKDIKPLDPTDAYKVLKLRPISFKANTEICTLDDPDEEHLGFIAEEVAEIEPRLVQREFRREDRISLPRDGLPKGLYRKGAKKIVTNVEYERISVMLVMLAKQQEERIKQLEDIVYLNSQKEK